MVEYIKREAAIKAMEKADYTLIANDADSCKADYLREIIESVPAADVVPVVHGRWERDEDGDWYCTNCYEVVAICESGRERTYRKPYCPNCGARMDGGVDKV